MECLAFITDKQENLQSLWNILCTFMALAGETWPRGYKTFFMLKSVKHEILKAHEYKNIKKFSFFQIQISRKCYFPAHL